MIESTARFLEVAAAITGCVLGILNTYWSLLQNRVKLKLLPCIGRSCLSHPPAYRTWGGSAFLNIKDQEEKKLWQRDGFPVWHIINLSSFSVHIERIGFCRSTHPDKSSWPRVPCPLLIAGPEHIVPMEDGVITLPVRLDSRQSLWLGCPKDDTLSCARNEGYKYMLVQTSCDHSCYANAKDVLDFLVEPAITDCYPEHGKKHEDKKD